MARAEVTHAKALAMQKEAALNIAKVNLENTFIRSPVDGVVIGRNIVIGQTVAASFQAPTLFTIAQDLRKMQVETNIDEADIGQITPGQVANFTVDSIPGRTFRGSVTQVRKKPQEVQNVVTYTVVLDADNSDLRLLPGMTAAVEVKVSERRGVIKIPNAALRFIPPGVDAPLLQTGLNADRRGPPSPKITPRRAWRKPGWTVLQTTDPPMSRKQKSGTSAANSANDPGACGGLAHGGPNYARSPSVCAGRTGTRSWPSSPPAQQKKYRVIRAEQRSNPLTPARVWVLDNGSPEPSGDDRRRRRQIYSLGAGRAQGGQEVLVGVNRQAGKIVSPASGFRYHAAPSGGALSKDYVLGTNKCMRARR